MKSMTYSEAREQLSETIQDVCRDHDPVLITRKRDDKVVMISLKDYEALVETAYLLRVPKNARRLLEAIVELESGQGQERHLVS